MTDVSPPQPSLADKFCQFNDRSKSPYHAVHEARTALEAAGFIEVHESEAWDGLVKPGGKYFVIRHGSTIVAFSVDSSIPPSPSTSTANGQTDIETETGHRINTNSTTNGTVLPTGTDNDNNNTGFQYPAFSIIAAHTDSPCFKLKPVSKSGAHGYAQVGVECYGGGLWHTWFDRDLTVAGRVIIRDENGQLQRLLVDVERPILRIPNLAIHLSRNVNAEGFKVNKESDTVPIIATQLAVEANAKAVQEEQQEEGERNSQEKTSEMSVGDDDSMKIRKQSQGKLTKDKNGFKQPDITDRHAPILLRAIADKLDISASQIVDLDLCVADTHKATIGGALNEFLNAPRLDNLASCYTGLTALLKSSLPSTAHSNSDTSPTNTSSHTPMIRVLACFDHEEVGSTSAVGADSALLHNLLLRVCRTLQLDFDRMVSRSLLVSADMAHAIHPNYASKHESKHRPALGNGLVIKTNQNQRYATNGLSGFVVREAARRCNVPVQEFVVPNDKGCGSTVGPALASKTGMLTVDVGQPQLAMHSVREVCAVKDFALVVDLFTELLCNHCEILDSLS